MFTSVSGEGGRACVEDGQQEGEAFGVWSLATGTGIGVLANDGRCVNRTL